MIYKSAHTKKSLETYLMILVFTFKRRAKKIEILSVDKYLPYFFEVQAFLVCDQISMSCSVGIYIFLYILTIGIKVLLWLLMYYQTSLFLSVKLIFNVIS